MAMEISVNADFIGHDEPVSTQSAKVTKCVIG